MAPRTRQTTWCWTAIGLFVVVLGLDAGFIIARAKVGGGTSYSVSSYFREASDGSLEDCEWPESCAGILRTSVVAQFTSPWSRTRWVKHWPILCEFRMGSVDVTRSYALGDIDGRVQARPNEAIERVASLQTVRPNYGRRALPISARERADLRRAIQAGPGSSYSRILWWQIIRLISPLIILAGLCITAVPAFRVLRRSRWATSGRCPNCGYHLTGLASDICPECGQTAQPGQS